MRSYESEERHYKVVRYYSDFNAGLIKEEIGSNLTRNEAEELANRERGRVPGEEIDIQDQDRKGLDAEVDIELMEHELERDGRGIGEEHRSRARQRNESEE